MRRALTLSLGCLLVASVSAQPAVPPLTGRVVDTADLLAPLVEAGLVERLAAFEDSTSAQVAVLTIASLEGAVLEDYATTVFRTWGLGQAGANNGVLLLVARDDRELRIEVGYGLEGSLTDALAGRIIRGEIVPRFKDGDYDAGIVAGVEAILGSIEGTYTPPDEPSEEGPSVFMMLLMVGLPLFGVGSELWTGRSGSDGDVSLGITGALAGAFAGVAIGALAENWLGMGLALVLPVLLITLNRVLEATPGFGPARRKRRERRAIIKAAQRKGKTSVVIDGVSYRVPSASSGSGGSSGGGFSGGGGSSGGGGASGSW